MQPAEWAVIAGLVTSVLAAIRWMVKYYLHELQPNSGSSIKDQVTRIESRQDKQEEKIDKILFFLAGGKDE